MVSSGSGPVKLQTSHSANAPAHALRMMKAERLSGLLATHAMPGDAEVTGKVGQVPLWPRISPGGQVGDGRTRHLGRSAKGRFLVYETWMDLPEMEVAIMYLGSTVSSILVWKGTEVNLLLT